MEGKKLVLFLASCLLLLVTSLFLGIYSFLLAFAFYVFGFFLINYNWCLSKLSRFRTRSLFSFYFNCFHPVKNNCKPDISQGSSHVEVRQDSRGRRGHL